MSTLLPDPPVLGVKAHDQYVVSHGRGGAVGVFTADEPMLLRRGTRVLLQTARGMEVGEVLSPATIRQARLLGATSSGMLVRAMTVDDEGRHAEHRPTENAVFEAGRAWAERDGLALEILDVELLFDGQVAILQFVGKDADTEKFAQALEERFSLTIRLENLAIPAAAEEHHHCDKPDCGREAGGGCTTCSTGGGCSSCGSAQVDIKEYFGHLRTKMEANNRIPLT